MKFMPNPKAPVTRGTLSLFSSAILAVWLTGCSSPANYPAPAGGNETISAPYVPSDSPPRSTDAARERFESLPKKAAEERPGLATGFGETTHSPWNRQSFVRASSKPAGTGAIYYNDREGIDAMTGYRDKVSGMQTAAGDMVEWGIKGSFGFSSDLQHLFP